MIEIKNLSKKFESFHLHDINISVEEAEYFVLLGPSGAGKSVLFELIAGILKPDAGTILLQGEDITRVPIQDRKVGLVFQDNTLFPHLSVRQNIEYALKVRHLDKEARESRIMELAVQMKISELLDRRPATLSGGEVQRVAIARALAFHPLCLLLDEPMSSIDVQLREDLRKLLRRLNREGLTILHITHDYREAFSLAGRIAIIDKGKIIQCGRPDIIHHNPVSAFVAEFTGQRNFFSCKALDAHTLEIDGKINLDVQDAESKGDSILIPDKNIQIIGNEKHSSIPNTFTGIIEDIIHFPDSVEISINIGILLYKSIPAMEMPTENWKKGDEMKVFIKADDIISNLLTASSKISHNKN